MDELTGLQDLLGVGTEQLSFLPTIYNFICCVIMAFVVKSFYVKYSTSLTGKLHLASAMPILATVVFLVIVIVKSSLALSLGLVGALSIVRFRTPIKEPEELVYLFLMIAVGLGYGAGYLLETTFIVSSILLMIYISVSRSASRHDNTEYNLVIECNSEALPFETITNVLREYCESVKLIRLDYKQEASTAVLLIMPSNSTNIQQVTTKLREFDTAASVSFFEAKTNW